jgi:hypothetical protein
MSERLPPYSPAMQKGLAQLAGSPEARFAFEALSHAMRRHVQDMRGQIAVLEARIKHLEETNITRFAGTWKRGDDYLPGDLVIDKGGLWRCREHTGVRPAKLHEAWQMVTKSGCFDGGRDATV